VSEMPLSVSVLPINGCMVSDSLPMRTGMRGVAMQSVFAV
jgi:hypothetical protein